MPPVDVAGRDGGYVGGAIRVGAAREGGMYVVVGVPTGADGFPPIVLGGRVGALTGGRGT